MKAKLIVMLVAACVGYINLELSSDTPKKVEEAANAPHPIAPAEFVQAPEIVEKPQLSEIQDEPKTVEEYDIVPTSASITAEFEHCKGDIRRVAIHEAGHFLLCYLAKVGVGTATIERNENVLGYVRPLAHSPHRKLITAAGYASEMLFYHDSENVDRFITEKCAHEMDSRADLAELLHKSKAVAKDLIQKDLNVLRNRKAQILYIAANLYKFKTLNEQQCRAVAAELQYVE